MEVPTIDNDGVDGKKRRSGAISPIPEESTTDDIVERHAKRVRRPEGRGMVGMLTSTLSAIKRESEAGASAALRRSEIEAKASARLAQSERKIAQGRRREDLLWQARDIAEQIAAETQRKTMRALKRRMASFLWTDYDASRQERGGATIAGPFASTIPTTIPPDRRRTQEVAYPIYFLPGTTLPEQEDLLNQQEDDVDDQIERLDDAWQTQKQTLLTQLERIKSSIRDIH